MHKFRRLNAQRIFQPQNVIGIQVQFKFPAAAGKTLNSGMALKLKGIPPDNSSSFGYEFRIYNHMTFM